LFEDQAVRTSIGVALVVVCLGLAGCNLFGKKQGGSGPSKPFLGSRSTPAPAPAGGAETASADASGALPGASGVLAGQVVDRFNNHPSKVYIQVVDLQDPKAQPSARLEVESQPGGFFYVPGLKPGRHYRLVARMKDGDKMLTGVTLATPPNPRLSIYLSEDLVSGDTPPVPDPPSPPGTRSSGEGAKLDPPEKPKPGETPPKNDIPATPGPTGTGWVPSPNTGTNPNTPAVAPDRIVDRENSSGGWGQAPKPPLLADVPSPVPPPAPSLPPAPSWNPAPGSSSPSSGSWPPPAAPPAPQAAAPFPGMHLPTVNTPVPSCVVVGRRVENFALNDLNLEPWEFKRHRRGRLVLLDFWRSGCPPCLEAMGHLVKFQQTYGPYGLEIIGIAYVQGTPTDQVGKVRGVRARYGVTYTTLLGAGMSCPVKTQLQVEVFPTLILLDESGQIVWHSHKNGLGDEYTRRDLETEVRRRLGIP
jgi:thiol-disulfide isomerase/thioredoxin